LTAFAGLTLDLTQQPTVARTGFEARELAPDAQAHERRDRTFDADRSSDQSVPVIVHEDRTMELLARFEEDVVGLDVRETTPGKSTILRRGERNTERRDDLARDPLLEVEHIAHRAGVLFGPALTVRLGIHELRRNPQRVPGPPHATGEYVAHTRRPPDLAGTERAPLVLHARGPRRHAKRCDAREVGDDLLREAVAEILVLRLGAEVQERQHGNGIPGDGRTWLIRHRRRWCA
jgi:hypothetical protein